MVQLRKLVDMVDHPNLRGMFDPHHANIEAFSRDDIDFANAINVWREYNPRMEICRDGYQFVKAMIEKHALA